MTGFRFLQSVNTPNGPATFIANMTDGDIQVSRMARFDELSPEEMAVRKHDIGTLDREQRKAWLKKATYCVNEIYPAQEVTA